MNITFIYSFQRGYLIFPPRQRGFQSEKALKMEVPDYRGARYSLH